MLQNSFEKNPQKGWSSCDWKTARESGQTEARPPATEICLEMYKSRDFETICLIFLSFDFVFSYIFSNSILSNKKKCNPNGSCGSNGTGGISRVSVKLSWIINALLATKIQKSQTKKPVKTQISLSWIILIISKFFHTNLK